MADEDLDAQLNQLWRGLLAFGSKIVLESAQHLIGTVCCPSEAFLELAEVLFSQNR